MALLASGSDPTAYSVHETHPEKQAGYRRYIHAHGVLSTRHEI